MVLIDTAVWIVLFRDKTGNEKQKLSSFIGNQDVVLTRFNQLELLQGCKDEHEWSLLNEYLQSQEYLETKESTWAGAARIDFELRRAGKTVRSPIDCCIAQLSLENDVPLLHRDSDFEIIASIRPLRHINTNN